MRLPIKPLLDRIHGNDTKIAEHLNVNPRTIARWKQQGIPADSADKAAIRIGSHPIIIWGPLWETQ